MLAHLCTLCPDLCTLCLDLCTLCPDLCTLCPDLCTLCPDLCTLHPDLCTLHPDLCTLHLWLVFTFNSCKYLLAHLHVVVVTSFILRWCFNGIQPLIQIIITIVLYKPLFGM